MKYFIYIVLILLSVLTFKLDVFGQENKEQSLINLLTTGRYFEATKFYNDIQNECPFDSFFELYYKYETARMLNQSDSATVFMEKLIEEGDEYWGENKFYYYTQLLELYTEKLQNYTKALYTCEKMREYLNENPFNIKNEEVYNGFKYIEGIEEHIIRKTEYPIIKFSRNSSSNIVEINEKDGFLYFDGIYNNKKVRTLFDTGFTTFFFMSEVIADSVGAKKIDIGDETYSTLNGMILPIENRIIDSIRIGNASLYNIPVSVFKFDVSSNIPDSTSNIAKKAIEDLYSFYKSIDIVIGYPAMFLMEKITINYKEMTFAFPENKSDISIKYNIKPNFFIYSNAIYAGLEINNIPLSLHIDFGSNSYVQIESDFYTKYKEKIPLKILNNEKPLNISMLHKTWQDIPYEIPLNPSLKFNNMIIPNKGENSIKIYSLPNQSVSGAYDGHIGHPFFKSLGKKIVLDFKNMRIDVAE